MNIIAVSVILIGVKAHVVSGGVRVKGQLGGNASVPCSYLKENENYAKYFNKGKPETQLVRLDRGERWVRNSRFSLEDDKENRKFIVTIRNLSVEDAGLYWCGVYNWLRDYRTEVNLDVVQDVTTENAFVSTTTPSATVTRQRSTEPEVQHTSIKDKSVYLGVFLVAVMLLCGTAGAMFIIMKTNKAKAAFTQPGKHTEPDVDDCVHDKVIPTNSASLVTIQSPDSVIYATPTPSRNRIRSRPSRCEPGATRGCFTQSRLQHPDTVVYSAILKSQTHPQSQSDASLSASAQSGSIHYSKLYTEQSSHVLSDTSAFSQGSHDVYATVHPH